ncbi:sensor histidine kinase [Mycobacterium fragae]|nr:sensor histidine kinase [Mycobacterium fragae]
MFARPARAAAPAIDDPADGNVHESAPAKRPASWALRNWPVRWKVVAIVALPLVLAMVFGGLRIYGALSDAGKLRLAADRAEMVPAITKYMSALDTAWLANSTGGDVEGAKKNYQARKSELEARLADTDVAADVRSGVGVLLNGGQALLDRVASNQIGVRDQVTTYAPILLTAENAIDGSVRVDDEKLRAAAQGLSRAIGARGQMQMQQLLITRGGDLPEPELRTSMMTLAGTEPSTLFALAEVLGVGSPEAKQLQQQMVTRMAVMSDPRSLLVNNPALLRSIHVTDTIAAQVIKDTTASVTKSVENRANDRRHAAIRDSVLVLAAIVAALVIVLLVARSLIQPLRLLRDSALKVAHDDLEREITRVRAGDDRAPEPLPVYTTEEIGQVAHAVDELHTQALLLAGDEARLRLLVNDMFETMSRRNRSLVDQQLSLIDRLERNEEDPDRLESLFRLDHLAARMRRNGANLLVLAGAQSARGEQRGPVPLSAVINAAASEVEDYRRVETSMVPDGMVTGAAAGDIVHLLAELIDNALRYSPPASPVRVSAARRRDAGILLEVIDVGLGMTDGDRRIANMRLRSGGEVTPENARHMGLFVVGRLADRHGIRVRLRGSSTEQRRSGTTAEIYLPPRLLVGADDGYAAPRPAAAPRPGAPVRAEQPVAAPDYPDSREANDLAAAADTAERNGSHPGEAPISLLPRRSPGSSGITGAPPRREPPPPPRREPPPPRREDTVEPTPEPPAAQPVSNTASFFSSRRRAQQEEQPDEQETDDGWPLDVAAPSDEDEAPETDLIYQRMLSEWLVDPHELAHSADLDWKSVWDRGWSAAAEVENAPVHAHTDHGLPVREPGARLVPGAAIPEAEAPLNGVGHHRAEERNGVASNGGLHSASMPEQKSRHQAPARDPDAIRASISSHFGGVRAGRSHARETDQGQDDE